MGGVGQLTCQRTSDKRKGSKRVKGLMDSMASFDGQLIWHGLGNITLTSSHPGYPQSFSVISLSIQASTMFVDNFS